MNPAYNVQTVVRRVHASQNKITKCTEIEAMRNSLEAAKHAQITPPFSAAEGLLHVELIKQRSDSLTCLKAWALMADLRSHEAIKKRA